MKTCPTCSRVYDDETITYCLHDGSLLTTTTYDAAPPTMRVPVPRSTDPSAAATLYSDAQQSEPPPTISSSQFGPWAQPQPQPAKRRSGKILLGIVALLLLGAGIGLGIALSRGYWFGGDTVARKLDTNGDGSDKALHHVEHHAASNADARAHSDADSGYARRRAIGSGRNVERGHQQKSDHDGYHKRRGQFV